MQKLTSSKDADISSRILTKFNQEKELTLQTFADECERILNLRHGTAKIE